MFLKFFNTTFLFLVFPSFFVISVTKWKLEFFVPDVYHHFSVTTSFTASLLSVSSLLFIHVLNYVSDGYSLLYDKFKYLVLNVFVMSSADSVLGFFHLFQAVYFPKLFSLYSEVFHWKKTQFSLSQKYEAVTNFVA